MCNIKIKHTMQDIGITHTTICNKPNYKNGMCQYHYKKHVLKQTNWIDRDNYKFASQDDLNKGRTLKLCNSNINNLYRCIKNKIQLYSKKYNKYIDTDIDPNYKLFCVTFPINKHSI